MISSKAADAITRQGWQVQLVAEPPGRRLHAVDRVGALGGQRVAVPQLHDELELRNGHVGSEVATVVADELEGVGIERARCSIDVTKEV